MQVKSRAVLYLAVRHRKNRILERANSLEALPSFLLAAIALTGSPGPNTLSLAAVRAAFGSGAGFAYMFGLIVGMVGVIAIVGSGLQGVLFAMPGVAPVITALAGLYFAYLAWRIATAPPLEANPDPTKAPRWWEGTLLSMVNPKAYAAMAAMFSGFVLVGDDPVRDGLIKAGVLIAVLFAVGIVWLTIGSMLTVVMRDRKLNRIINVLFAVALVVSIVVVFLV